MKTFVLLTVCLSSVGCLPEIIFVSKSQIIDPGGDASLACYFLNPGKHDYSWVKSNENSKVQQISLNDSLKTSDIRYSLVTDDYIKNSIETSHESDSGNLMRIYRLDIKNVSVSDNGTYDCLIYINDSLVLYNSTSLIVIPKIVKREIVLLGDSARLECLSSQFPFTDVSWTRYHGVLPQGSMVHNGILTIPSTISSDTGLYICQAEFYTNNEASRVTRNVHLAVMPPLEVHVRSNKLIRPQGYDVNMSCVIESISPVVVTWSKDNVPLSQDSRIQMQMFDTEIKYGSFVKPLKVAELRLKNIYSDDYGSYICNVENEFGIDIGSIQLSQYL